MPSANIYPQKRIPLPAAGRRTSRREEVATMINDSFAVVVAGAALIAGTSHATHAAVPAAGVKHRAAATDASVDRGTT
ncbi:hypothetical protein NJB14197_13190 [Mycobacterium montefiorense]|uniref:Uncharacterized protein n=1 Tax=Mycobacterium montefiorense TaxID=154654 RepID=A0AA37PS88_9MYCO|nr:hypothetical protein MmonteBS_11250 [Mycobacterium montefiorense]GKU37513.1 hypothetical protein NJB14191_48590 [Mycobacterium montefiorense]GKU42619.1 hypothetical protein NJB14192_46020 [Mycobacterium montefiorense]GKU48703.1 hypothetical protein NJB14194_53180 [Mycobacterium montefiorense]GKU50728.1 hypothetical protein NJB14195_19740 [Mycobacterium montefiorense]